MTEEAPGTVPRTAIGEGAALPRPRPRPRPASKPAWLGEAASTAPPRGVPEAACDSRSAALIRTRFAFGPIHKGWSGAAVMSSDASLSPCRATFTTRTATGLHPAKLGGSTENSTMSPLDRRGHSGKSPRPPPRVLASAKGLSEPDARSSRLATATSGTGAGTRGGGDRASAEMTRGGFGGEAAAASPAAASDADPESAAPMRRSSGWMDMRRSGRHSLAKNAARWLLFPPHREASSDGSMRVAPPMKRSVPQGLPKDEVRVGPMRSIVTSWFPSAETRVTSPRMRADEARITRPCVSDRQCEMHCHAAAGLSATEPHCSPVTRRCSDRAQLTRSASTDVCSSSPATRAGGRDLPPDPGCATGCMPAWPSSARNAPVGRPSRIACTLSAIWRGDGPAGAAACCEAAAPRVPRPRPRSRPRPRPGALTSTAVLLDSETATRASRWGRMEATTASKAPPEAVLATRSISSGAKVGRSRCSTDLASVEDPAPRREEGALPLPLTSLQRDSPMAARAAAATAGRCPAT